MNVVNLRLISMEINPTYLECIQTNGELRIIIIHNNRVVYPEHKDGIIIFL